MEHLEKTRPRANPAHSQPDRVDYLPRADTEFFGGFPNRGFLGIRLPCSQAIGKRQCEARIGSAEVVP